MLFVEIFENLNFFTFSLYSSQWKTSMHACDIDRDHGPLLRFLICPRPPNDDALEQEDEESCSE